MDREDILKNLLNRNIFPADTVSYCLDNPERSAAIFLPLLNKAAKGIPLEALEERAFYLGLHILAQLRTPNTLSLLQELALNRPHQLLQLLGEEIVGTTFTRILMCVGTEKGKNLWQVAQTHSLDFLIRDAFLRAWTFEVLEGRVNAVAATQTLRAFLDADDAPASDDPIWSGWLIAIADLGYTELAPIAERAIRSGRILAEDGDRSEPEISGFETALKEAKTAVDLPTFLKERGYVPFGEGPRDWGDCFMNAPHP